MTHVKVKICGITNARDAQAAVRAGADALGFVFYRQSPRSITPAQAGRIISQLPPFVAAVGVFVDPLWPELGKIIKQCRLEYVQLHGAETPAFCRKVRAQFKVKVIKAFRVIDRKSLNAIRRYNADAYLLDTYQKDLPGGTGRVFNWRLVSRIKVDHDRLIIAGGLTPENVGQTVQQTKPWAVDVGSGVESSPGKKDHGKIKKFIRAAKHGT